MLADHNEVRLEIAQIKEKLGNQDKNMELIFTYLDELSERLASVIENVPRKRIGYLPDP